MLRVQNQRYYLKRSLLSPPVARARSTIHKIGFYNRSRDIMYVYTYILILFTAGATINHIRRRRGSGRNSTVAKGFKTFYGRTAVS